MAYLRDTGVIFCEEDRGNGPFIIRIGGTSEFVSDIDPAWKRAFPPGRVEVVEGWSNPEILRFDTMTDAVEAAIQVWDIEGYHTSIEVAR